MPDLQTQDEDMEPNRPAQEHAGVAAAEVAMQGQAVPSDQTAAQWPTAACGTAQALNVSRPQSQSQAYEELENFVSSLSASRLFPDMEAQDEADSFNVVRAGSQPSHGAALSQVHFNILTPLVLLWQSGQGVQVAVDLSCSQTMLDKMRIILRHCGPASVFSVQPTVVYSPVELCKQYTAASMSTSAPFTPSQLPPVATFQGLLPCNLGQDAGPGLLWVELWRNTTCMSAQPLLLLQQTDADWASELAVYLGRLEEETANVMQGDDTEASSMAAAHAAGLAAGQPQQGSVHNAHSLIQQLQRYQQGQHNRPALSHEHEQGPGSRNSNQSSGAHSNRSGALVPLLSNGPKQASQQLIQDLGRWLAYARACSQHNQSCASQQQQQSLPVDLMSASDRDRSSAQAGTTAGSPSVAASAAIEPALPPWAGVRTSSLNRFMVESALALLLEATEAGCALSADALMRSFMEAGMSVQEVVAATWQPAAGSQDLPLLHAAVMSCSPQMVSGAFLCSAS